MRVGGGGVGVLCEYMFVCECVYVRVFVCVLVRVRISVCVCGCVRVLRVYIFSSAMSDPPAIYVIKQRRNRRPAFSLYRLPATRLL